MRTENASPFLEPFSCQSKTIFLPRQARGKHEEALNKEAFFPAGAGGTLLFFGFVCVAFIPFAVFCLPETKGQSLEGILPMFAFRGREGFKAFVNGNLRAGNGVRSSHAAAAGAAAQQGQLRESRDDP